MPEDIYEQDRFYKLGSGHFLWMYHNPDANSGDQFVKNHIPIELLKEAIEGQEDPVDIFGWIGSECRQYCSDVGDPYFDFDKDGSNRFSRSQSDARGIPSIKCCVMRSGTPLIRSDIYELFFRRGLEKRFG